MRTITNVTVPISQILNANPAWVRSDAGVDLSVLTASIKKIGLQQPVLLASDFLVLDGARRVLVYAQEGWTDMPAVVTDDWHRIKAHLIETREREDKLPHDPMSWLELAETLRMLQKYYGPVKYALIQQTRRVGKAHRSKSQQKYDTPVARDMVAMLGLGTVSKYRVMQDLGAALARARGIDPGLARQVKQRIEEIEQSSGRMHSANSVAREMVRRGTPKVYAAADVKAAKHQIQRIDSMADTLSVLRREMDAFGPLNSAIDPDALHDTTRRIRLALRNIRPFVKELEHFIQPVSGEDSKP